MLELKLGWQSLRNNKQLYLPFTLATSLLIGVFYIFQAIINNDSLAKIPTASAINSIMQVALVFTSLIIVVFMFYINNIVAKQRNKELGLYSMLGMTKANLFFLVLGVDVCLFGFSLVLGLLIGLSFIKFVLLAFVKLLDLKLVHLTVFSGQALLLTVAFFLAIFMALLLVDLAKLSQVRPVELWNATKKGERLPKNSWFTKVLGLAGVATLIGGYYLSVITKPNASVITTFFLAIILVVIGTYALFTSASIFFLNLLKQNKNYYYKRNHFITVSGMLYRMKQNGVGLASICLLCTASIVALVATSSLMAGKDNQIKQGAPLDVSITSKKITPATYKRAQELAAKYKVTLINKKSQRISHLALANIEAGKLKISQDANTANYEVLTLPLADYNRVEGAILIEYPPKRNL